MLPLVTVHRLSLMPLVDPNVQDPVTAGCGHTFCRGCIREFMDSATAEGAVQCPTCSRPLTVAMDQARNNTFAELHSASPMHRFVRMMLSWSRQ